MKTIRLITTTAVLLLLGAACTKKELIVPEGTYTASPVTLSPTLPELEVGDAYLFAFDHETGELLVHTTTSDGKTTTRPTAVHLTVGTGSWQLPARRAIDILGVVNPPETLAATLDGLLTDKTLTRDALLDRGLVCDCPAVLTTAGRTGVSARLPMTVQAESLVIESRQQAVTLSATPLAGRYDLSVSGDAFEKKDMSLSVRSIVLGGLVTSTTLFGQEPAASGDGRSLECSDAALLTTLSGGGTIALYALPGNDLSLSLSLTGTRANGAAVPLHFTYSAAGVTAGSSRLLSITPDPYKATDGLLFTGSDKACYAGNTVTFSYETSCTGGFTYALTDKEGKDYKNYFSMTALQQEENTAGKVTAMPYAGKLTISIPKNDLMCGSYSLTATSGEYKDKVTFIVDYMEKKITIYYYEQNGYYIFEPSEKLPCNITLKLTLQNGGGTTTYEYLTWNIGEEKTRFNLAGYNQMNQRSCNLTDVSVCKTEEKEQDTYIKDIYRYTFTCQKTVRQ